MQASSLPFMESYLVVSLGQSVRLISFVPIYEILNHVLLLPLGPRRQPLG